MSSRCWPKLWIASDLVGKAYYCCAARAVHYQLYSDSGPCLIIVLLECTVFFGCLHLYIIFKHAELWCSVVAVSVLLGDYITVWFTLCSLTGRWCNQHGLGLGLSGLVHEKAHPVIPDIAQSRLECIDAGCLKMIMWWWVYTDRWWEGRHSWFTEDKNRLVAHTPLLSLLSLPSRASVCQSSRYPIH